MREIRKCTKCKTYTLKTVCSSCGEETKSFKNYKFMINEKYIIHRLKEKGLLSGD